MADRFDEYACGVCRRYSAGIGYHPPSQKKIMWVCDDPDCLQIAIRNYPMSEKEFNSIERRAIEAGGRGAGEFLETIGKSDMAKLSFAEWDEFCRRMVGGYCKALKQDALDQDIPF